MAQPQLDAAYKLEDDAEPEPADVETLTTGVELTKSGRLSRKGGDTNVDYFKQLLVDAPGRFARTTAAQAPIRARAPVSFVLGSNRVLECRVGPCNVLHLLQHAAAAPFGSVVRENIFKLVNEGGGIVLGDRRILELLMTDPQGPPGWRMGPTYES